MPQEKRDPHSGAKLFIPTADERTVRSTSRQLKEELSEVQALKKELKEIIASQKKEGSE